VRHDDIILLTRYNRIIEGGPQCAELGCIRDIENIPDGQQHERCRAIHAEQYVIAQAANQGIKLIGTVLYCTHQPCSICARLIVAAGIKEVKYIESYPDANSIGILQAAGVRVTKVEYNDQQPAITWFMLRDRTCNLKTPIILNLSHENNQWVASNLQFRVYGRGNTTTAAIADARYNLALKYEWKFETEIILTDTLRNWIALIDSLM